MTRSGDRPTGTATGSGGGEIFLQAIAEPGPDPFGPSVANSTPSNTVPPDQPVVISESGGGQPPQTAPRITPGSGPANTAGSLTANAIPGNAPGLFGGTRDQASCDKQQMIDFLAANPDKASAWARVQGIEPANLATYVNDLTPVLLRGDTRVTNHGFANGDAYPIQAVLQAGTAVLVDRFGTPRVRCACGNPLIAPVPLAGPPDYKGPGWTGFSPTNITVINASTTVINIITIVDVRTGTPFGRPPRGPDVTVPPVTAPPVTAPPVTPTTAGTTPTTRAGGGATTSTAPGSSWRLREIKIHPAGNSPAPNVQIVRQPSVSGGELLLTFPDSGLCNGAGTGTTRFSWTIGRDVTLIRNGDAPVPFTVTAAGAGNTGACNAAFPSRAYAVAIGSDGDGSLAAGAIPRLFDQARFSGGTPRAVPTEQGGSQTISGSVAVSARPSNASTPTAYFAVKVEYPGAGFYVLYIYDLA